MLPPFTATKGTDSSKGNSCLSRSGGLCNIKLESDPQAWFGSHHLYYQEVQLITANLHLAFYEIVTRDKRHSSELEAGSAARRPTTVGSPGRILGVHWIFCGFRRLRLQGIWVYPNPAGDVFRAT